jgi:hypothetical protein
MLLPALYHWSPRERLGNILRRGLLPGRRPHRLDYGGDDDNFRQPGVCLGPTPSFAWGYSAAIFGEPGTDWDLWQVSVVPGDEVRVQPTYMAVLGEARVHNRIPKSRIWWVGERTR